MVKYQCSVIIKIYILKLIGISGKSLLCKEGAIRMTKQPKYNHDVYYISLLAVDKFGKPKDEYFTFDEASKLDLQGTGVKVLDVHQLLAEYKQRHPELDKQAIKALLVYELVEDLVDAHPKASYFLDECPFAECYAKWWKFKHSGGSIIKTGKFTGVENRISLTRI